MLDKQYVRLMDGYEPHPILYRRIQYDLPELHRMLADQLVQDLDDGTIFEFFFKFFIQKLSRMFHFSPVA